MSESESPKKEELIIQQKVYDMIMYAYPAIEQFPKAQKFSLAQDMKRCLDNIMRYIIAANKKYTKKNHIAGIGYWSGSTESLYQNGTWTGIFTTQKIWSMVKDDGWSRENGGRMD